MKRLCADIETYSEVNLSKTGVYRYAEDASFEMLLFGVSIDGSPVKVYDVKQGEELPEEILSALQDNTVIKSSFNAMFERVCLSRYLWDLGRLPRGQYLDPRGWHCDMVWAGYMGFPMSLKSAGAALGLDEQKMEEGGELITYFCKPYRATARNGYGHRNLPEHAPEKWELFKAYNQRDVEVEMAIEEKLKAHPVPLQIWEEYVLDQEINDRGIGIDTEMVKSAIQLDEQSAYHLREEMQRITRLSNPQSVIQMQKWLKENGVELESLGKKELAKELDGIGEPMRTVLLLRQQLAMSAVKKYKAMESAVCADGRLRGMFRFYGANRSGRFSSAITQLQNLFRNTLPDLEEARSLVKRGDYDAVAMLYESVPEVLAQCVRTVFIPSEGMKFIVADFSSIEARVLAWLAGEQWKMEAFRDGKDIYCETASRMFHVKVEKHGENAEYRQRGKQAELSCIAEGQLVLTDKGLIPIERVTTDMRVWDGEEWVKHEGVIYRGEREVIEYEGLTATSDHFVYVEGQTWPIRFEHAAASGAHLVQTGNSGRAIWLGENNQSREEMGCSEKKLFCFDTMPRVRRNSLEAAKRFTIWTLARMLKMFFSKKNTLLVLAQVSKGKAKMRKPKPSCIQALWRAWNQIRFSKCNRCRALDNRKSWSARQENGARSNRQRWKLRSGEHSFCNKSRELWKQAKHSFIKVRARILAIFPKISIRKVIFRKKPGRDNSRCQKSSNSTSRELAFNRGTAEVYDIRDAGRHHCFTVSGKLVHNCGYGGGRNALKVMGALEAGMKEEELQPLVEAWRRANPRIVKLWADVEEAAKTAVKEKTAVRTHGLEFTYRGGMLYIRLPSGRKLSYVKPRMGENRYGGEGLTYMGNDFTRHWARIPTFGGKLVENCLSEGTLVITDNGLVPIEGVTRDMRVWDGEEYVSHSGVLYQGRQVVMTYDGLTATPDHKIYIDEDRKVALRELAGRDSAEGKRHVYDVLNAGPRHRFAVWNGERALIVSNCVQGISRDILCHAMEQLRDMSIVAHIHDELLIECSMNTSVEEVCGKMAKVPSWAEGLTLRADGYECKFYRKD